LINCGLKRAGTCGNVNRFGSRGCRRIEEDCSKDEP
jgi:hypothetical protein